ncbi:putative methyltransferase-domain-containing protein [Entophlyctis helioformis]|nr:putative methyltransferase-domain-containing protein [Entophlyctis helioformis]
MLSAAQTTHMTLADSPAGTPAGTASGTDAGTAAGTAAGTVVGRSANKSTAGRGNKTGVLRGFFHNSDDSDSSLPWSGTDSDEDLGDDLLPDQPACAIGTTFKHPVRHCPLPLGSLPAQHSAGTDPSGAVQQQQQQQQQQYRILEISEDTKGGCGGKAWDAALVMTDYISHRMLSGTFPFRRILEVGSGTGMVGLVAAMDPTPSPSAAPAQNGNAASLALPDRHITITDLAFLVPLMEANAQLNLQPHELQRVSVAACSWGMPLLPEVAQNMPFDLILVSDCVYMESLFDPLIQTLIDLTAPSGSPSPTQQPQPQPQPQIWFASQWRWKHEKRFWKKLAKTKLFAIEDILDDPERAAYLAKSFYMKRVTRKA